MINILHFHRITKKTEMLDTRHTHHTTTNLPIQSRAQITSFSNDCDYKNDSLLSAEGIVRTEMDEMHS